MRWLLGLLLLLVTLSARADTYYLLSGCTEKQAFSAPYPFNPQPKLTQYMIEPGIWLVEDAKVSPKVLQQTLTQLQAVLAHSKSVYAEFQRTNVVAAAPPRVRPQSEALVPQGYLTPEYFAESLRARNPFKGAKRLPESIKVGTPGWQDRAEQWARAEDARRAKAKAETKTKSATEAPANYGDPIAPFNEYDYYSVSATPLPTPFNDMLPSYDETNGITWRPFQPTLKKYETYYQDPTTYLVTTNGHELSGGSVDLESINSIMVETKYPDGAQRTDWSIWNSVELVYAGKCFFSNAVPFIVTNYVGVYGGAVGIKAYVTFRDYCYYQNPSGLIDMVVVSNHLPRFRYVRWEDYLPPDPWKPECPIFLHKTPSYPGSGQRGSGPLNLTEEDEAPFMLINEPHGTMTNDSVVIGQFGGRTNMVFQSTTNLANPVWVTRTNLTTPPEGYGEVEFPLSPTTEYFRVFAPE